MTPGEPIRRTADDEKADLEQAVKHVMTEMYREWPNEAGFDGLKEEKGPIEIKVRGSIPAWAAGSLYRTGPGIFEINDTPQGKYTISHWFDGLAHTHRFDIIASGDEHATVMYSSRRQSEALMQQIQQTGRHAVYTFGQRNDPCMGLFSKFMAAFYAAIPKPGRPSSENVCVTVQVSPPGFGTGTKEDKPNGKSTEPGQNLGHRSGYPASVWLATDTSSYRQIDPMTLEPIGFATQAILHPDLKGPLSCAHGQRDPTTGDMFNFNQNFGKDAVYRIFRVSAATGKTDILAVIQRAGLSPSYIHSFYLSPSFAIICIPSSHIAWNGLKIAWERSVLDAIKPFDENDKCKWFVVDRLHGRGVVAEFETPAGFFFHTVNSFEETDEQDEKDGTVSLFCDVIQYATTDVLRALYYDTITQKNGATQKFWDSEQRVHDTNANLVRHKVRVPVAVAGGTPGSKVQIPPQLKPETVVSIAGPHCGELPTINPAFSTKRHRYCYGLANRGLSTLVDTIAKTDMDTGEALWWNTPAGHTPGEAIFVGRPGAGDEDDGVLLSVVLDGEAATSYLLCLDARTMKELGKAEVGFAIGLGFHGAHAQA